MAERTTARAKRQDAPKAATKGARKQASKAAAAKVVQSSASNFDDDGSNAEALADENQQLKADLALARQRIAELEAAQTDITNRIAWVIDSLHNLSD